MRQSVKSGNESLAGASAAGEGWQMYIHDMYTRVVAITKVFRSGNSQAVRIPKQFQVDADEMEITRRGEALVLRKRPRSLAGAYELLARLSNDFMKSGRKQPKPPTRAALCSATSSSPT